jgi:hypothetical protein
MRRGGRQLPAVVLPESTIPLLTSRSWDETAGIGALERVRARGERAERGGLAFACPVRVWSLAPVHTL